MKVLQLFRKVWAGRKSMQLSAETQSLPALMQCYTKTEAPLENFLVAAAQEGTSCLCGISLHTSCKPSGCMRSHQIQTKFTKSDASADCFDFEELIIWWCSVMTSSYQTACVLEYHLPKTIFREEEKPNKTKPLSQSTQLKKKTPQKVLNSWVILLHWHL